MEVSGEAHVSETFAVGGAAGDSLVVLKSGNVGIGTDSPSFKLDVKVDVTGGYAASFSNTANSTTAHGIRITSFGSNTTGGANAINFIRPDGAFIGYIGQATSTTVSYNTTSDRRLKENITASRYGLSDLMNVKVRDFKYINDPEGTPMTGFIAQELYDVFPNAVSVGGEDPKKNPWGVDYGRLTPLLVKAVQDQQAQILEQKAENDELRSNVETLTKKVEALEQK